MPVDGFCSSRWTRRSKVGRPTLMSKILVWPAQRNLEELKTLSIDYMGLARHQTAYLQVLEAPCLFL
ncbi:hypothetical protein BDR04DRAFT_1109743 [Suillus decipiens]|nr:hypothetical protein BDR04DRAFT_1109743 [Suillus decipiens]